MVRLAEGVYINTNYKGLTKMLSLMAKNYLTLKGKKKKRDLLEGMLLIAETLKRLQKRRLKNNV